MLFACMALFITRSAGSEWAPMFVLPSDPITQLALPGPRLQHRAERIENLQQNQNGLTKGVL